MGLNPVNDRIARRILVKGRVQGVWFRAWTVGQANELGLDGWVRNRADGAVEAIVAGPAAKVDELVARCHRGSPASRVDTVIVEEAAGVIAAGFTQKPTL